jgi:hypothetical protein
MLTVDVREREAEATEERAARSDRAKSEVSGHESRAETRRNIVGPADRRLGQSQQHGCKTVFNPKADVARIKPARDGSKERPNAEQAITPERVSSDVGVTTSSAESLRGRPKGLEGRPRATES